uniref:Uncharacterized protein n=1 Tax=Panagrellus redivivus TaxID=6233 RepID=A0A7E4VCX2_PANRE
MLRHLKRRPSFHRRALETHSDVMSSRSPRTFTSTHWYKMVLPATCFLSIKRGVSRRHMLNVQMLTTSQ